MKLDRNSYGTIAIAWAFALVFIVLFKYLLGLCTGFYIITAVLVFFSIFVTWFHRVPNRAPVGEKNQITSVADGKVVIVEKVFEKEYLQKECIQISVYMNFFNVHSNFWPLTGEITYYKYHPGAHILAFYPKSSEKNEHSSSAIKNEYGEIFFKQIAGTFARRIVCYSKVGESTEKGKQIGIIKFGSRIDMFLPLDADIKVKVGDLTRACETIIAEL